jgi:uroporphyrinogen decarboxylase
LTSINPWFILAFMDKKQRVLAALEGRMDDIDRPPASVWYHFGTAFLPGSEAGKLEAEFFRRYDWDFLKMMNDYPWPFPDGLSSVESPEDLSRFPRLTPEVPAFREQLSALKTACRIVGRTAFVIDTVFNPFGVARRTMKKKTMAFLNEAPDKMLSWLERCAENQITYLKAAEKTGIAGIFFSVNGADTDAFTDTEFDRFVKPFDMMVLEAAKSIGPLLVGHIHGGRLRMDRVFSYPVAALNWSHLHDNESIAQVRARSKKCIIGGMDEIGTSSLTPDEIIRSVHMAAAEARGGGFMAGPGCAVPSDAAPALIGAPRRAVETLKR